ncbi:MAG TPA: hydantoinase/oxoprolinase family protein [Actinomycetes bacterium]|nr:hydantoinase/oxoprolinase family protein [Actinomycetes bacterium]
MQRVGVDIGGTFTDLVVYDEASGDLRRTKVRTVPSAPEEGLLEACRQGGVDFGRISSFMHATTLVTNLVLTRTGAKVGLLTTRGFRDVLEIGRVYRNQLYNLQWDKPRPFVPRYLVREVDERIDMDGNVLEPLDERGVEDAVRALLADGVEALAVCLFNAYANGEHERAIGQIARSISAELAISLSSDVDPRIREYQRTSTTVLNAYAMPRTRGYIERLAGVLGVPVRYMHSGGGIVPSGEARAHPIILIASGPAAGVLASQFIGRRSGIGDLITMDVGGTSCDICVLRDGEPEMRDEVEVEWGIPARTQGIDVASVGAGGGSIAWVDEGGTLRVGPQSAGADPGPACYDRGGTAPTATDANLVLGILDPGNFLGGRLRVVPGRSREALEPIAAHFGVSVEQAALGVFRLLNANMAQAILEATVKRGIDPRDFTLICYGGAGGQFAVAVAEEVGIRRVLVPPNQSVLSAFGLLTADLRNTASQTLLSLLTAVSAADLGKQFQELGQAASAFLQGEEASVGEVEFERLLDVRYVGQSTEVPVPVAEGSPLDPASVYREFERLHELRYGTRLGDPAEVVNVRVTAVGTVPTLRLQPPSSRHSGAEPVPKGSRRIAFLDREVPVYDRDRLEPGTRIDHPCVIEEVDSSFLLLEGWTAHADEHGNLVCQSTREVASWSSR